jgi:hypothetical protein
MFWQKLKNTFLFYITIMLGALPWATLNAILKVAGIYNWVIIVLTILAGALSGAYLWYYKINKDKKYGEI